LFFSQPRPLFSLFSPTLPRAASSANQQAFKPATVAAVPRTAPTSLASKAASVAAAAVILFSSSPLAPASAAVRLPPIDSDPLRCERAFTGNTIGQANAVSDKTLDLRGCKLAKADLSGKTLSGALLSDADLAGARMVETVMTKAYAVGASFKGADLSSAVIDRVDFSKADLSKVNFTNAILTGVTFEGADLSDAVFEDALIGNEDAKRLCANPTLKGESRLGVGCRGGSK
jgi:uncharacterized protein YjbI with pentapeptide repeats